MRLTGVSAALLLASLPSTIAQHASFHPLSCNANLTVSDCNGGSEMMLSSIVADHLNFIASSNTTSNTTTPSSPAVIPCGVCAVADISPESPITAPHGIDVQGMLYVPSNAVGTLETAHMIIQGIFKIDPHTEVFNMKLIGGDYDVMLTPHEENMMACDMGCNLGKRPIAVVGGTLDIKGVEDTSESCPAWVKLRDVTSPPPNSNSTETLETILHVGPEAASCWDSWGTSEVLLTPSSTRGHDWPKTLTIKSIDVNMGTVTVAAQEADLNDPSTWENGLPELSAEVAGLNRPVKFDSVEDGPVHPTDLTHLHGGHLIVFHTPYVAQKLEGVEFTNFGQQGNLGRYPIHFHWSYDVAGSVVRKNVVRNSNQRCIVIHVTDSVLIENNIAFNTFGHCFITENGGEINNVFKDNLGSRTKLQWRVLGIGASDDQCSTFWVTSPRNEFNGNVASASARSGFWFELLRGVTSGYPVSSFVNNTSHNNNREGFKMYPKGYHPNSLTYFDGLVAHSNGNVGMFIKRSGNFRIRNAIFANNQVAGIHNQNNNFLPILQDSAFYARLERHMTTECNSAAGVKLSLDKPWSQIQIKNTTFEGYGNVLPGCNDIGLALQLENIQGMAAFPNYALPYLEGNTFTSNDPEWAFQIAPGQFGQHFRIFLEDSDGAMNPGGNPGFFVHNTEHNTVFLPPCVEVGGKYSSNSELLFCEGICLRKASFNTLGDTVSQMVITSRTDTTKTHTYGQGSFDTILPSDDYDVRFKDPVTGEDKYHSTNLAFSALPACTEYVTKSSFFIAQPPQGYFPLYKRFNVSDVAAFSNVEVGANSIGYIDEGDWWSYSDVYFGQEGDTTRIRLSFSKANIGGTLQVRLGDRNGDVIATFDPYSTGGWDQLTATEATFVIDANANVSGLNQVTFVATGISLGLMNLHWWELAPNPPPSSSPTLAPSFSPIKTPTASPIDSMEESIALWSRKDAGDVSAQQGVVISASTNNIGYFDNGDWFTYDSVYFGVSPGQVGQIRLRFSKGNYHGRLEIRLGDQNGPVIGDFLPYFTGGWGTYKEATFAIDAGSIEGYHQVTFRGWDTSGVMGVDFWELAPPVNPSDHTLYERKQAGDVLVAYRVNVASWGLSYFDRGDFVGYENIWFGEEGDVSKITVRYAKGSSGGRIEARLDGRYGAVLGSFYPSVTGSYGTYVEATFDLSSAVSVSGLHMLYLIGYDLRRGIWNVNWLQLAA